MTCLVAKSPEMARKFLPASIFLEKILFTISYPKGKGTPSIACSYVWSRGSSSSIFVTPPDQRLTCTHLAIRTQLAAGEGALCHALRNPLFFFSYYAKAAGEPSSNRCRWSVPCASATPVQCIAVPVRTDSHTCSLMCAKFATRFCRNRKIYVVIK